MRTSPRAKRSSSWEDDWNFRRQIAEMRAQVMHLAFNASEDVARRITSKFRKELKQAFRRQIERQKRQSGYPMASQGETSSNALYESLQVNLEESGDTRYISAVFGGGLPYSANLNKPIGTSKQIDKTPGTRGLMVPNRKGIPRGRKIPATFVVQAVDYPGQEVFDRPYQKTLAKMSEIVAKAIQEAQAALKKKGVDISATPKSYTVRGDDYGIVATGNMAGRRFFNVRNDKGQFTKKG